MKIAKMLVIAAILAPVSRADDSQALANKFLDLSGTPALMQQSFESGIKSSLDRMRAQGAPAELVDTIPSEALKFFADNFKWDDVKPKLAKLYTEAFTEAELREIITFYSTPTGQKFVAKLPVLTQQGGAMAMSGVQDNMPAFQQKIAALIESYKRKQADAAKAAQQAAPGADTAPAQPSK